jgi:hypothetical protein
MMYVETNGMNEVTKRRQEQNLLFAMRAPIPPQQLDHFGICLPCHSDLFLVPFSFDERLAARRTQLLEDGWKAAPTSGQCVHAVLIVVGLQATA